MNSLVMGRRIRVASAFLLVLGSIAVALPVRAEIALRVAAGPQADEIKAFVRATDESGPLSGLGPEDFVVTLDGAPIGPFGLTLPSTEDPTQRASIVIVANHEIGQPPTQPQVYVSLIERLVPGDFAAVILLGRGEISWLPFRSIDGGAHSQQIVNFLETGQSGIARIVETSILNFTNQSKRGLHHALAQFENSADKLPDGPKAIVNWSIPTRDFDRIIGRASQDDVSIFTRPLLERPEFVTQAEAQKAIADSTGGVAVAVGFGSGSAIPVIASWLKDGYQLTIPATVADDCDLHMLEVTVDAQVASAPFVRCDATPDFKLFPVLWNADPGLIVSETLRVTGMTSPAPIAAYSGKYSIGCNGTFTAEPGYIQPDEEICMRHMNSGEWGLTQIFIGGIEFAFRSSTSPPP